MKSNNKTISITLPAAIADRLDAASKQQGRSRSEFVREALLPYLEEYEWRLLTNYGERRVREMGLSPKDVNVLVDQYRSETRPPGEWG